MIYHRFFICRPIFNTIFTKFYANYIKKLLIFLFICGIILPISTDISIFKNTDVQHIFKEQFKWIPIRSSL